MTTENSWAESMKNSLEKMVIEFEKSNLYKVTLPNKISLIPQELHQLNDYGHPIKWVTHGSVGTQAFAIGTLLTRNPKDDNSEKHLTPPVLSRALAQIGPEYMYSQVAILVLAKNEQLNEVQQEWISIWLEERSSIRRVCLVEDTDDFDAIARDIMTKILLPWQGVNLEDDTTAESVDFAEIDDEEAEKIK